MRSKSPEKCKNKSHTHTHIRVMHLHPDEEMRRMRGGDWWWFLSSSLPLGEFSCQYCSGRIFTWHERVPFGRIGEMKKGLHADGDWKRLREDLSIQYCRVDCRVSSPQKESSPHPPPPFAMFLFTTAILLMLYLIPRKTGEKTMKCCIMKKMLYCGSIN